MPFALRVYTVKSNIDQIVCSTGVCTVGGVHSSTVPGENASYTVATRHFGVLTNTAVLQADLIR